MKSKVTLFALSLTFLIHNAIAGTMSDAPPRVFTWVSSINGGLGLTNAGDTQNLFLTPSIVKTYSALTPTNPLAVGELFFGAQGMLSGWQGQLGLELAATNNAKVQGVIWDDADPSFNNYSYQYDVNHGRVALKGKILLDTTLGLLPWISGGIGVGMNTAHNYTNTPLTFEAVPNTNFTSHTQASFTYNLGLGVQSMLNAYWQIGVGYEFADLGGSSLGRAEGQSLNSGLTLNNLYVNAVLFNLTYIA